MIHRLVSEKSRVIIPKLAIPLEALMRFYFSIVLCVAVIGVVSCKKSKAPQPPSPSTVLIDTPTLTHTGTFTRTATVSRTATPTTTATWTVTRTPTVTFTRTRTLTPTITPYATCVAGGMAVIGNTACDSFYPITAGENTVLASPITVGIALTARAVRFYKNYTGLGRVKAALYASEGVYADPTTLICQSAYTLSVGSEVGWYTVQVPQTYLPAGTYWVATWTEAPAAGVAFGYSQAASGRKIKRVGDPDIPASITHAQYAYDMNFAIEYCP